MVFSSVFFLYYFLPAFLLLYATVRPARNVVLLVASLLFYAWGEAGYIALLLVSILANYGLGLWVASPNRRIARWSLILAIAVNLLLLGYFKYANFLVDSVNLVFGALGFKELTGFSIAHVHLPVGISFFTFQAMSYVIDVYRGDARAERNPFHVALYISMFPQLVAGPIVRFQSIAAELHERRTSVSQCAVGVRLFMVGLAQKVLVANQVAVPTDAIFALPTTELTASLSWFAVIGYTLQIYYDFAGYSNMAIGLGLMMGFHFPINFNYPYIAQSVTEFWRRWHITLSRWFRDYLYIPLGGNRIRPTRTYLNLILVFLLCGLWHGASVTFIIWGLFHGMFLVIERSGFSNVLDRLPRPTRHAYTLLVVMIGWVFFRAETPTQACSMLGAMFGAGEGGGVNHHLLWYLRPDVGLVFVAGALFATPLLRKEAGANLPDGGLASEAYHRTRTRVPSWLAAIGVVVTMLLVAMNLAAGTYNPFIYFRF